MKALFSVTSNLKQRFASKLLDQYILLKYKHVEMGQASERAS